MLQFYKIIGAGLMTALLFLSDQALSQKSGIEKKVLIYQDDFTQPLDAAIWKAEFAKLPGSSVKVENGKLILDTQGGATVWFNKILKGNIEIQYTRTVVVDGGANDRLSDFNQFWMAGDPRDENLFTRDGVLEKYDSLSLYYVGMGGNSNTTTRFRKYPGDGQRVLIGEFTDKGHLLTANRSYQIKTVVKNGVTEFWVDGVKYFSYQDPDPLTSGYFGFRFTKSRHEISGFKVYQLGK